MIEGTREPSDKEEGNDYSVRPRASMPICDGGPSQPKFVTCWLYRLVSWLRKSAERNVVVANPAAVQPLNVTLKMRDMKLRDMKMRHRIAAVENARHENARNAIVWNTACCICLSIAEQECMSRQERANCAVSCAVNCVALFDFIPRIFAILNT